MRSIGDRIRQQVFVVRQIAYLEVTDKVSIEVYNECVGTIRDWLELEVWDATISSIQSQILLP